MRWRLSQFIGSGECRVVVKARARNVFMIDTQLDSFCIQSRDPDRLTLRIKDFPPFALDRIPVRCRVRLNFFVDRGCR